ncbi:MAG: hypothetical protein ACR2J4_09960 [Deinococcus sp.]
MSSEPSGPSAADPVPPAGAAAGAPAGSQPPDSASTARQQAQQGDAQAREVQYTRKLILAILSTLQHKGLLSPGEVDAILLASRRAADASVPPTLAVRSEFSALPSEGDLKRVRHEPKAPPVFDIQIDG